MPLRERQLLPHGPEAPAKAREAVESILGPRLDEGPLAELALLVSELVTNAVRHGRDRRGAVELGFALAGNCVRVEVCDGGSGFVPPGHEPAPEELGGWGLVVVDRLADRWGVDGDDGTRVWFELAARRGGGGGGPTLGAAVLANV
jgi:anti-sigma regulatory factor (Ser/Thr protein kinase)